MSLTEASTLQAPTPVDTGDLLVLAGSLSADVSLLDWDDLFRAVKERLRLIVDAHAGSLFALRLPDDARRLDVGVLECVAALDQLHLTMSNERARRERLEREVAATQATLERVAAALAQVQAETRNG